MHQETGCSHTDGSPVQWSTECSQCAHNPVLRVIHCNESCWHFLTGHGSDCTGMWKIPLQGSATGLNKACATAQGCTGTFTVAFIPLHLAAAILIAVQGCWGAGPSSTVSVPVQRAVALTAACVPVHSAGTFTTPCFALPKVAGPSATVLVPLHRVAITLTTACIPVHRAEIFIVVCVPLHRASFCLNNACVPLACVPLQILSCKFLVERVYKAAISACIPLLLCTGCHMTQLAPPCIEVAQTDS